MAEQKLTTASVLAFERKLSNSDGFMYAGNWPESADDLNSVDWQAIKVTQKDVRGVISNRLKNAVTSDEAKLDAEIQKANLQTVDTASLPEQADSLKLSFSLRVLGDLTTPSVCNNPDYQDKLQATITSYIDTYQFEELANRYAINIASGRFLWRNRIGAEEVVVEVKQIVNNTTSASWLFSSYDFDMRDFSINSDKVLELAEVIKNGLLGNQFSLLEINAYARLGKAQEVFPSQELVLDTAGDSRKSKYLYQVNDTAAMHSQKIGNALRTIDTWYPEAGELGPIAVEPYGSVTSRGKAYRQPKQKQDFYTLLDNWVLKDKEPEAEQQHYIMAMLIRGGVFGEAG
jgi:CRISPR-associated protein Csy3